MTTPSEPHILVVAYFERVAICWAQERDLHPRSWTYVIGPQSIVGRDPARTRWVFLPGGGGRGMPLDRLRTVNEALNELHRRGIKALEEPDA